MSKVFVQENFFDTETYKIITEEMIRLEYKPPEQSDINNLKSCYWHYHQLPEECEVQIEIKKLVKKYFFYEIEKFTSPSIYTMVGAADHPKPHRDNIGDNVPKYQLIVYMLGPESINSGTGFYDVGEVQGHHGEISVHVGFKPNRAIFFSSETIHSPLQWAGNGSFRYSINNFFR